MNSSVGTTLSPVKVRQHYVVARILKKTERQEQWSEVRRSFITMWKRERTPRVLDEWLTEHLKDLPRWVSMKHLKFLRIEALKFESPLQPKSQ